jgi:hypothetical protein
MINHIRKNIKTYYKKENESIYKYIEKHFKTPFLIKKEIMNDKMFFYANNSIQLVKTFMIDLKKNNKTIRIEAKRININTIMIKSPMTDFILFIINLWFDNIDFLTAKKKILEIHYYLHRLSFPDIYNLNSTDFYFWSQFKTTNDFKMQKNNLPFKSKKIIWIGSNFLNKKKKYHEIIYIENDIYDFIKSLKKKYVMSKSDFEFRNIYFDIYDKNKHIYRIYKGGKNCYPYIEINNNKIGSIILILKFLALDCIYESKYSFDDFISIINKINIQKNLFKKCYGKSISSYVQYYKKNWENNHAKPWLFIK